jgi:prepilin-type N-terminal cleavage/methylation domain-containing protein
MGRRSSGFTLIEMLASIAVIGILAALLLPAVQAAREAARHARCASNLKQIALAMTQYHDTHGTLPPGKKGCCWGTWLIFILPQVEQQALYNAYNFAGISATPSRSRKTCPATRSAARHSATWGRQSRTTRERPRRPSGSATSPMA